MDALLKVLLKHPIAKKPYNAIRFSHFDQNGTPLYALRKVDGASGAKEAMNRAFKLHGAHCFHCDKYRAPDRLGEMTRDHVVPRADQGSDFLHNLVFACKSCNVTKGAKCLVSAVPAKATLYLTALNRHVERSVRHANAGLTRKESSAACAVPMALPHKA